MILTRKLENLLIFLIIHNSHLIVESKAEANAEYAQKLQRNDRDCRKYFLNFDRTFSIDLTFETIVVAKCEEKHNSRVLSENLAVAIILSGGSYFSAASAYHFFDRKIANRWEDFYDRSWMVLQDRLSSRFANELDRIYSPHFFANFIARMRLKLGVILENFDISSEYPLHQLLLSDFEVMCKNDEESMELQICMGEKLSSGYLCGAKTETVQSQLVNTGGKNISIDSCNKKRGMLLCCGNRTISTEINLESMQNIFSESNEKMDNEKTLFLKALVQIRNIWNTYFMLNSQKELIRFLIPLISGSLLTSILILLNRYRKMGMTQNDDIIELGGSINPRSSSLSFLDFSSILEFLDTRRAYYFDRASQSSEYSNGKGQGGISIDI